MKGWIKMSHQIVRKQNAFEWGSREFILNSNTTLIYKNIFVQGASKTWAESRFYLQTDRKGEGLEQRFLMSKLIFESYCLLIYRAVVRGIYVSILHHRSLVFTAKLNIVCLFQCLDIILASYCEGLYYRQN